MILSSCEETEEGYRTELKQRVGVAESGPSEAIWGVMFIETPKA